MLIQETGAIVAGANTYATLAEADAYAEQSPGAVTWEAKTDAQKEALLIQAARILDAGFHWLGSLMSATQALQWPRYGVPVLVGSCEGLLDAASIPAALRDAQCEVALLQAVANRTADPESAGIDSVSVGKGAVSVKFDATTTPSMVGRLVPLMVRHLTSGQTGGAGGMVPTRRV